MKIFATHKISSLRITNWLFLTAALALVVLAGISACAKIDGPQLGDDGWNDIDGAIPIKFSSNLATHATKSVLPEDTYFGVFAFYTNTTAWNSVKNNAIPNFMFNERVSSNNYSYAPLKYWPNQSDDKITFWAYYPYSAISPNNPFVQRGTSNAYTSSSNKGIPEICFTNDGQTDLLISNVVPNKVKQRLSESVLFTFNHTLSLIKFTVKKNDANGDYTVNLTSLGFANVYNQGVLRNTHQGTNFTWNTNNQQTSYINAFHISPQEVTTSETAVIDSVMVIPQELSASARLYVEYTMSWVDHSGNTRTKTNRYYCPISGAWVKNNRYTYKITITPDNPIEFTIVSAEWIDWGDINDIHLLN